MGLEKATQDIKEGRTFEVPTHLKDASYTSAKKLGHGVGYKYAHDFKDHYIKQEYIPEKRVYYEPTDIGFEKIIKERLEKLKGRPGE
jgi:putative ATPase